MTTKKTTGKCGNIELLGNLSRWYSYNKRSNLSYVHWSISKLFFGYIFFSLTRCTLIQMKQANECVLSAFFSLLFLILNRDLIDLLMSGISIRINHFKWNTSETITYEMRRCTRFCHWNKMATFLDTWFNGIRAVQFSTNRFFSLSFERS